MRLRLRDRPVADAGDWPRLTTAMVALAWCVINTPDDSAECARVLAKLIIDECEGR